MADPVKKTKSNLPGPGPGRPKGGLNKTTALLKDAILLAATQAGNLDGSNKPEGLVSYLKARAIDTPGPFLALVGKVLPLTVAGDKENPLVIATKEQRDAAFVAATRADA